MGAFSSKRAQPQQANIFPSFLFPAAKIKSPGISPTFTRIQFVWFIGNIVISAVFAKLIRKIANDIAAIPNYTKNTQLKRLHTLYTISFYSIIIGIGAYAIIILLSFAMNAGTQGVFGVHRPFMPFWNGIAMLMILSHTIIGYKSMFDVYSDSKDTARDMAIISGTGTVWMLLIFFFVIRHYVKK
jgi:succinate dehydrogenase hydrophobic anchor subunit